MNKEELIQFLLEHGTNFYASDDQRGDYRIARSLSALAREVVGSINLKYRTPTMEIKWKQPGYPEPFEMTPFLFTAAPELWWEEDTRPYLNPPGMVNVKGNVTQSEAQASFFQIYGEDMMDAGLVMTPDDLRAFLITSIGRKNYA